MNVFIVLGGKFSFMIRRSEVCYVDMEIKLEMIYNRYCLFLVKYYLLIKGNKKVEKIFCILVKFLR